jgi:hypothetical protein
MNRRNLVTIIFIITIASLNTMVLAKRLARFPEINRPYRFEVYGDSIYIGEQSSIAIYSLKDFSFIKRFGSKGEGPGEFKSLPMFQVFPKYIVVNNFGKWLLFSHNGNFLEEKRNTLFTLFLFPVGENFVATTVDPTPQSKTNQRVISLLDKNLKPIKEIGRRKSKHKKNARRVENVINDCFQYRVYKDKIFLADTSKGFYIEVFDNNGELVNRIEKKYQPIKVTEKYKKEFLKEEKKASDFIAKMKRSRRYKYVFRDYFPAFEDFCIKDDKIYVFSYKTRENKREVIVMNLDGKILKKVFVTKRRLTMSAIENDRFYYLKENMDKEEWELYADKINKSK